jgi:RHS repeat-associated protein
VASYVYDALNHRIGINDNGTQMWVVFDGSSPFANPYADFNGSGTLLTRYVSGPAIDALFARTSSGGTTAWYLPNRLGSVRDIANSSGTVIDHVVYDSYGNVLSESGGANSDRFRFTGMEYDAAIGQYYDHARWYGGVVGRFDAPDPIGFLARDPNLFRYVANTPTNLVDASGNDSQEPDPPPGTALPPNYAAMMNAALKAYQDMMAKAQMQENKNWQEMYKRMKSLADNARLITEKELLEVMKENAAYSMAYKRLLLKKEFFDKAYDDQYRMLVLEHELMHSIWDREDKDRMAREITAWENTMPFYQAFRKLMGKAYKDLEAYYEKWKMGQEAFQKYVREQYNELYKNNAGGNTEQNPSQ